MTFQERNKVKEAKKTEDYRKKKMRKKEGWLKNEIAIFLGVKGQSAVHSNQW